MFTRFIIATKARFPTVLLNDGTKHYDILTVNIEHYNMTVTKKYYLIIGLLKI